MNKLELIKENARLNYGIIQLIEELKKHKEFRKIERCLTDLILPVEGEIFYSKEKDKDKLFAKFLKDGDKNENNK